MFLVPPYYSWVFSSLHQLLLPPIFSTKVSPTWFPVLVKLQVALAWSSLRVPLWFQQYHFNLASFVFFSSTGLSVVGVFDFAWVCNSCSWFESTILLSCACVSLWERIKFRLARFAIASLSSIAAYASACIASALLTWASVSCVWFSVAPHPWYVSIDFLRIL